MRANDVRRAFLEFFASRGHTPVPSASLIPHDPSILFTIAGMVPFKPYFTGDELAPYPRAVSIQRCVRTVDIDIIGTTQRHCTYFEMLGNFSFGDYFKPEAIAMAWELLTEVFGLEADRLWVTVHDSDDDAADLWVDQVGVPASRIQRLDEDNFWRMGDTGPCGPCSEIFFDKGPAYGADGGPKFGGDERFVEIWNLVFMQYLRHSNGDLVDLPKKNIDTGSGLERMLAVLQGVDSVFSTDLYLPLLEEAQSLTGATYGKAERDDVALRILADHGRAMTMLVADGVTPSNEGRGYVLRRLIRRAMLAARRTGADAAITARLAAITAELLAEANPGLHGDLDRIQGVLGREEEGFERTIRSGLSRLEEDLAPLSSGEVLSGGTAFKLHDTYGFPVELTVELAHERGVQVDVAGFEAEMAAQRARAREAARQPQRADEQAYREILAAHGPTRFVGREPSQSSAGAQILAVFHGDDGIAEVVLDQTPFYAEGGGQVGDTGTIETSTGRAIVLDTVAVLPGLSAHRARLEGEVLTGQEAIATIDAVRREAIRRNHTATHLLHAALRNVLGDHVRQQGSLVAPDRLRFDFTHDAPLTDEQLAAVVDLVNADVLADQVVETVETGRDEAAAMGAIAFFGDRYGDRVRVVRAGGRSLEFCGGTHVASLGQIGPVVVVTEASIGAGVRRIEATTGHVSIALAAQRYARLAEAAELVKAEPEQVVDAVRRLVERNRALEAELGSLRQAALEQVAAELAEGEPRVVVARRDGFDGDQLRTLVQSLRRRGVGAAAVLGSTADAKVALAVATDGSIDAGATAKAVAQIVGGGGGGAKELAVAGGRDASKIDLALAEAKRLLGGS